MTFDAMLARVPNIKSLSLRALSTWGYNAQDAHQEALVMLWEFSLNEDFVAPDELGWYLFRSLRNAEINKYRKTRHYQEHNADYLENTVAMPAPYMRPKEFLDHLEGIREDQKQVLFLSKYMGYEQSEVAEMVGVPIGTIKSRMGRACAQLKKTMTESCYE